MAILMDMDKPENCIECSFLREGGCVITGNSIWDEDYDWDEHKLKNCPLIEIEVDIQTFTFLQEMIMKETLTYKELAEAVAIVKENRKQTKEYLEKFGDILPNPSIRCQDCEFGGTEVYGVILCFKGNGIPFGRVNGTCKDALPREEKEYEEYGEV